jgi:hypothetical protein
MIDATIAGITVDSDYVVLVANAASGCTLLPTTKNIIQHIVVRSAIVKSIYNGRRCGCCRMIVKCLM